MKRALSIAAVAAVLIQSGETRISAQVPDGPLNYFNSSFVTGDVVVGGASLFRKGVNGLATQDIVISGVPAGAEILSAYLYVQTTVRESAGEDAGIAGATFKGNSLNTPGAGPIAKALNWAAGTQACWSYGWNPRRRLVTYRADVLRFLQIDATTGKHIANGPHRVQVADAGRVNIFSDDHEDPPSMTGPRAVGASLVLIYRHPNPATPLRAIVIYDGGVTKRSLETMTQRIQGIYDPAPNPDARMTHIVGDGQLLFSEQVKFGTQVLATNPFIGLTGTSFPRWDNRTFNLPAGALKAYPDSLNQNTVTVSRHGLIPDCLSWSGIVVSANVRDADNDGALDLWESSSEPILDPTGEPLPLLSAMGGKFDHKDIYTEIGYLKTDGVVTYGQGPDAKVKAAHTHKPTFGSLKMVYEAFRDSPVVNPDGTTGIAVHFDVGNDYQVDPDPLSPPGVPPFIIPASLARGGKNMLETEACTDPNGLIIACPPGQMPGQYPFYPGTVGWKTGYRFYRDELLGFDRTRRDIFRYALYVHSVGLPKSEDVSSPDFQVPRTNSGVADWAGADVEISLGAFDDELGHPVGTTFMQASTLMHEFGHFFKLRHGGDLFEPNCKPQYQSVMNYLYQLRGLPDEFGIPRIGYNSGGGADGLNEASLADGVLASLRYRMGWYAPQATSYLKNLVGGAATKHCDGSPLPTPPGVAMVRLDAIGVTDPIDWNGDGTPNGVAQDINFDGLLTSLNPSTNDWAKIRLNQVSSRRTPGGLFLDSQGRPTIGPLSLNVGKGDLGKGDLGKGDLGKGDLGKGDLGKGDLGKGDLGKGDLGSSIVSLTLGKGDLGKGDLGGGDLDVGSGAPNERFVFELDHETATASNGGNPTPPSGVQACLTVAGECVASGGDSPVKLTWLAPNLGSPIRYLIYRFPFTPPFEPPADVPTVEIASVTGVEGGPPPTTYLDYLAPPGENLAYFVIAQYPNEGTPENPILRFSGISNFATIATPPRMLAFIAQPASTQAGQTMPAVTVAIQSATGALVNLTGVPITLAIAINPPGNAVLSGTITQTTVNGVATFANLSIDKIGTGFTLMAGATSFVAATSTPFNVTSLPLSIVTEAVPDGTQGAPYAQSLAAQGGVAPYTWSIVPITGDSEPPEFVLPTGLVLTTQANGTGLIAGTPTTVQVRSFRVRVTDFSGQTAEQDLCIHVEESTVGTLAATALGAGFSQAQLDALAGSLAGAGVMISSVTYTGASGAVGSFTGGFGATGLNSGLILSSGSVVNVDPPNNSEGTTTANNTPGDADLNSLIPGFTTRDAAVLEFDFVVTDLDATTVKFDYVFASEEYNEFVYSAFNDVFGFFMSGPEFPKTNLALVPNTTTPVSIDNVNGGNPVGSANARNSSQYINNAVVGGAGLGIEADGLTKVFSISAGVTPGTIYHLKIAIADAGDSSLDSWVMLKAGSFGAVCPIIVTP